MNWNLRIANRARKALDKLPAKDQRLLLSALEAMRIDPFSGKIKRLTNERSALVEHREEKHPKHKPAAQEQSLEITYVPEI